MNADRMREVLVMLAVSAGVSFPLRSDAAGEQIPRSVVSAGTTSASGAGLRLAGTVGQLAVGTATAAPLAAGHGFWAYASAPVLGVDPKVAPGRIELGTPTPNPSRAAVAFDLGLPRAARVELAVVDVQGREVVSRTSLSLSAGRHRVVFTPAGPSALGPGVYFTRVFVEGRNVGTRRWVRIR